MCHWIDGDEVGGEETLAAHRHAEGATSRPGRNMFPFQARCLVASLPRCPVAFRCALRFALLAAGLLTKHCYTRLHRYSAGSRPSERASPLHKHATRVGLLGLLVKGLGRVGEGLGLVDKRVELLPPLEHVFDRLLENDLGLVELLLHLHEGVGLVRVLVLGEVAGELGEDRGSGRGRLPPLGSGGSRRSKLGGVGQRVLREKVLAHLVEKRVGWADRVGLVGDEDAGHALGTHVHVAHVLALLDRLSLVGLGALRYGLRKEGHELAHRASLEEGEGREVLLLADARGLAAVVAGGLHHADVVDLHCCLCVPVCAWLPLPSARPPR